MKMIVMTLLTKLGYAGISCEVTQQYTIGQTVTFKFSEHISKDITFLLTIKEKKKKKRQ